MIILFYGDYEANEMCLYSYSKLENKILVIIELITFNFKFIILDKKKKGYSISDFCT